MDDLVESRVAKQQRQQRDRERRLQRDPQARAQWIDAAMVNWLVSSVEGRRVVTEMQHLPRGMVVNLEPDGTWSSWVDLPGVGRVQSVPGGSHWGGGVSISAHDQARIGRLLLDGGVGAGRQLLPRAWIERMAVPVPIAPFYGRLVWLNRHGSAFPGASPRIRG